MLNPKLGVVGERWHSICPHCHDPVYRGLFIGARWWHKHCWKEHRDKADIGYQGRMALENPVRIYPMKDVWGGYFEHASEKWHSPEDVIVIPPKALNARATLGHEMGHYESKKSGHLSVPEFWDIPSRKRDPAQKMDEEVRAWKHAIKTVPREEMRKGLSGIKHGLGSYLQVVEDRYGTASRTTRKAQAQYAEVLHEAYRKAGGVDINPNISDPWLAKAAKAMGVKEPIELAWSPSTKKWPDIWIEGNTITVTKEWLRQSVNERRKRLVHEILHRRGIKHGYKKTREGYLLYSTKPEKDEYSKFVYNQMKEKIMKNPSRAATEPNPGGEQYFPSYGISYERALELEGVSDYPRISAAVFHFDKLTPGEQETVIQHKKLQFKEALDERKQIFQGAKKSAELDRRLGIKVGTLSPYPGMKKEIAKRIQNLQSSISELERARRNPRKCNPRARGQSTLPVWLMLGGLAFAGWWIYSRVRSSP